ncbi:unnamed protein product [Paramecium octaurelia]|uniref:Uncharacterized protein n=1 Tax=Paramecium octaurelia TaxID=43137 RepID=A0A8S1WYB2_PAROT|nr:unnamed protein product [Paramecium octaurelia]
MFEDNFKQRRQMKLDNDANIKNNIYKMASKLTSNYFHPMSLNYQKLEILCESARQQQMKEEYKRLTRREFRNISNRRYGRGNDSWKIQKVEVIMDYDFPIQ